MRRHLEGVKCSRREKDDPETDNESHVSCKECIMALVKRRESAVQ